MSAQAVATTRERDQRVNLPKDNWLGFVGDVLQRARGNRRDQRRRQVHLRGHLREAQHRVLDQVERFVTIKGNATVGGGVATHEIKILGFMKAGGDCSAETFSAEGAFTIGGLLTADTVDIKLYGPCSAREIGGEKITVRSPQGFQSITQIFTFWADKKLTAESIEGDDVYLEATNAKVVRGRNVTIGLDCKVDVVEYSDNYSRTDGAMVGEARKVEATA